VISPLGRRQALQLFTSVENNPQLIGLRRFVLLRHAPDREKLLSVRAHIEESRRAGTWREAKQEGGRWLGDAERFLLNVPPCTSAF